MYKSLRDSTADAEKSGFSYTVFIKIYLSQLPGFMNTPRARE